MIHINGSKRTVEIKLDQLGVLKLINDGYKTIIVFCDTTTYMVHRTYY